MRILSIIPARGGSKGIKDKNIIDICGKPLIYYSIALANELRDKNIVARSIVSTDSEAIARISETYNISVPFIRPPNISGDKAKSADVILHALDYFENKGQTFDFTLLLQPTSPLRAMTQVLNAIEILKNTQADSLISCYREEYINDLVMYKKNNNYILTPLNPLHNRGVRRQDHGAVYVRAGNIYLTKVEHIRKTNQIISDYPAILEIPKKESINLDTYDDLDILRKVL